MHKYWYWVLHLGFRRLTSDQRKNCKRPHKIDRTIWSFCVWKDPKKEKKEPSLSATPGCPVCSRQSQLTPSVETIWPFSSRCTHLLNRLKCATLMLFQHIWFSFDSNRKYKPGHPTSEKSNTNCEETQRFMFFPIYGITQRNSLLCSVINLTVATILRSLSLKLNGHQELQYCLPSCFKFLISAKLPWMENKGRILRVWCSILHKKVSRQMISPIWLTKLHPKLLPTSVSKEAELQSIAFKGKQVRAPCHTYLLSTGMLQRNFKNKNK